MRTNPVTEIEGMSPEEYAALWGCDTDHDPPGRLGDGAMFYNFGSSIQKRTASWLRKFSEAISFQARVVARRTSLDPEVCRENEKDLQGLHDLFRHVDFLREELEEKQRTGQAPPRFSVLTERNNDPIYVVDNDAGEGEKNYEIITIGNQIPIEARNLIAIEICNYLSRNPF